MHHASAVRRVFHAAPLGNVRRWQLLITGNRFIGRQRITRLGLFVSSVKQNVRRVVMNVSQRYVEFLGHMQRKRSENRMALPKKRINRFSQAIIVELFGGNVPQDIGTGLGSPSADIDQCDGAVEPGGNKY